MSRAVPLESSRVQVERQADGLHVGLPKRRRVFDYVGAAWILGVCGAGLILMLTDQEAEGAPPPIFIALWALFGLGLFGLALWGLLHREAVVLDARELRVGRGIGRRYRWRAYTREGVHDLRISTESMSPFDPRAGLRQYGIGGGTIAFDYGRRTVRFGQVEEAEAKRVIAALAAEGVPTR